MLLIRIEDEGVEMMRVPVSTGELEELRALFQDHGGEQFHAWVDGKVITIEPLENTGPAVPLEPEEPDERTQRLAQMHQQQE